MIFFTPNITTASYTDTEILIKDRVCNPVLLKEVNTPDSDVNPYIVRLIATSGTEYWINLSFKSLNPPIFESLNEEELTKMCMQVSNMSLLEDWENEDDTHWESFLKD